MILLVDSEGPDQTARMRMLIWAFAVRIWSMFSHGLVYISRCKLPTILHVQPTKTQINLYSLFSLRCPPEDTFDTCLSCEDSDQTARMRRLIWVFARRKCNFVGNAVPQRKVKQSLDSRGLSSRYWCSSKRSHDAVLTTYILPHQNEAIGPNCLCNPSRNWCKLPALAMSPKFPSL